MRRQQSEPVAPGPMTGQRAVIRLDNVTKAYQGSVAKAFQQGGRPALAEVSITVAAGACEAPPAQLMPSPPPRPSPYGRPRPGRPRA